MALEILDKVDADKWNQQVIQLNGCCFHSYQWSLYSSATNKAKPIYFRPKHEADGAATGVWFGLLTEKKVAGLSLYRSLSFGSLPACEDHTLIREMIESVLDYCLKNRIVNMHVNSFGTSVGSEVLENLGFTVQKRWEFLLGMDGSEEELWKRVHSKKRNLIRKGQKEGLRIEKGSSHEHLMTMRKLAMETYKRKASQGTSFPGVAASDHYVLMKERLLEPGLGKLYLAYDGSRPVAGAFFVGFNRQAYYTLSAANQEGLKRAAPDLVLWTAITDYLKDGFKLFNLGGLSEKELEDRPLEDSGLYHFKMRFGARVSQCFKGALVLRSGHHRFYEFFRKSKAVFVK